MQKQIVFSGATVLILLIIVFLFTGEKNPTPVAGNSPANAGKTDGFVFPYKSYPVKLPEIIDFAGEPLPLNDWDVNERLDRELLVNTYWQSQTIYLMKLANRWFPVIEPILKEQGVPDDFKYLALAESGLQNVISPSEAVGVWQFLKGTAKDYGLEVNDEVDERYNLEKSTEAACRYFKNAYAELGSWTAAAAAYNVGLARMKEQVAYQQTKSYYDLWLNNETSRYVFRAAALKEIMLHPQQYGFEIPKENLYSPFNYKLIRVDTAISDLFTFARQQNTSYKMLKMLNPWLRNRALKNPTAKEYQIKVSN